MAFQRGGRGTWQRRGCQGTSELAEAEPLAREAVAMFERLNGNEHGLTGFARGRLGRVLRKQKRFAEAETELLEGNRILSKATGLTPQSDRADPEADLRLHPGSFGPLRGLAPGQAKQGLRHQVGAVEGEAGEEEPRAAPAGQVARPAV
jgi:hypothetical protein